VSVGAGIAGTAGPSLVGETVELEVGQVAHGGFCVARLDGRAVFVRHALPGERVRALVTEQRARYLRADAVEILSAAPGRVPAPCPYARPGRCGGCDWQHVSLPAQRVLKATVVAEQLQRLAGLDVPVVVEEVPDAPDGLGWRTRVAFAVRRDGSVGLHRHRSHEVEPVERCLIAHPAVEAAGVEARSWPRAVSVEVAAAPASGQRVVLVTPAASPGSPRRRPGRGGQRIPAPTPAPVPGGPSVLEETAAGRRWRVSAGSFWQVHPAAADVLVEAVLEMLEPRPGDRAVDLYAGAGLFAGVLADRTGPRGPVVAVESDPLAAADAVHNLADRPGVRVVTERVGPRLFDRWSGPVDLVVLDPPRAGAGAETSLRIAGLGPRAIAYVACDPAALARDVAAFATAGYRLSRLRAFDLFPMTAHVECVALLSPGGPG